MIDLFEAMRLVEDRRDDAVVITTMMGSRAWRQVSQKESLDLAVGGTMGKASSVALGICLARPDKRVILFDGDGSLLMNLGTLVTVGGQAPENLYHFVVYNGVYAVTGGQPVPNAGGFSFAGLARAAGYTAAFEFDDLEEFATSFDEVMSSKGPVLVSFKTEAELKLAPIHRQPSGGALSISDAVRELAQTLRG